MSEDGKESRKEVFQAVTDSLISEVMPPSTQLRVTQSRDDGGLAVMTEVVGHEGDQFQVYGLEPGHFMPGSLVEVSFSTETAFYSFVTKVAGEETLRHAFLLVLERPSAWRRFRRRVDHRMAVEVPMMAERRNGEILRGGCINMSISGVLYYTAGTLSIGEEVTLIFSLPLSTAAGADFTLPSRVVREAMGKEGEANQYGLKFLAIDATQQEQITRFFWSHEKRMLP